MTTPATPDGVNLSASHAEYVAGSIAAAWCKADMSVRAHRGNEAAALIRAQSAALEQQAAALQAAMRERDQVVALVETWRDRANENWRTQEAATAYDECADELAAALSGDTPNG